MKKIIEMNNQQTDYYLRNLLAFIMKSKNDLKLLFVNPCLRPGGYTKFLPVGLGSVMTYFKTKGYDFTLLDIDINEYDDEYVENYIKTNKFDFVLCGTIVTHYKWVKWFVNMVKKYQPNSKIIVGNSVAGSIPEVFLKNTKGDIVVTGEGEISAYEAVEAIRLGKDLKTIEGISFRDNQSNVVINPARKAEKIDELPEIDWSFFDVESYIQKAETMPDKDDSPETMRSMPVVTARGCAFKCTFCHYVFWNDPYRNRKPQAIITEIKHRMEQYNINYIHFWDDLSFASAIQVEKFCDAVIESGLKFKWMATIRVDLFSRANLSDDDSIRVAKKMKQCGCYACGYALESGNDEIMKMMNKKIEVDAFYTTVYILKQAGIISQTSVVFGYPIETKETIKETFDQCLKAGLYPSIGFLLPLPYTVMYDYAKTKGFITDEDKFLESITERQDICLNMTKMSDEEIMNEIKIGAARLNEMLDVGLTEDTYIKTKGYKSQRINKKLKPLIEPVDKSKRSRLDPKKIKRIRNDVSFNYSQTDFKFEEQSN